MKADLTPYAPFSTARFLSSEWPKVMGLLLMAWVALLGLYATTALSLVETWAHSSTYSHGFLILPLSGYLVWRQRHRLAVLVPRVNPWALLLLSGLASVWLLGHLTAVVLVQQLALVTMVAGMVWAMAGTNVTSMLLFPLAFLFFAVPAGEDLVPLLQDFTASFTVTALQLSGIPVFWEGRYLTTPSGSWHVAEACAGLRYLITGLTLGVFFAGVVYRSWARRVVFVLAAILVPILANGVRAYGIVLFGYLVDHQLAAGVEHIPYGWVFFSVVMFLLFWVGFAMREPDSSRRGTVVHPADGGTALPSIEEPFRRSQQGSSWTRVAVIAGCGVGVVALAPLWVLAFPPLSQPSLEPSPFSLAVSSPWQAQADYTGKWTPSFEGANTVVTRTYANGDRQVHLFLAVYTHQQQGRELVSQANTLVDRNRWVLVSEGRRAVRVDDQALEVRESRIRSGWTKRLVWSWYWVDEHMTSNAYVAKLLQAKAHLLRDATAGAAIALAADYQDSPAEAVNVIEEFLQHTSFLQASSRAPDM